jgi:iron complex outermembrane receptor protein
MADFELSLAKQNLSKVTAMALVIPALTMVMQQVKAETVKKTTHTKHKSHNTKSSQKRHGGSHVITETQQEVNAKPSTPISKSVVKASETPKITQLSEMVVTDSRDDKSRSNGWLKEDTSKIPVQERTKLGQLSKTAPFAGSIIDQEELKTVKYVDILRDQLNRIPGLSMIRSMRIPDGAKSYTNNLMDGMLVSSPQNQAFTFMDQFNPAELERFEVTRGIGSVLYPSNGITGAFNVVTKSPSKTPEYWLSQEFGTYNFFRTQGAASGTVKNTPLNDVGYFAAFNAMEYDPWKARTKTDRKSFTGKLEFHPDELSNLTLRLDHYDLYIENPSALTIQQFNQNWQQANPSMLNLYQKFEYLTGGATYKRQIGKGGELEVSFVRREQNGTDANPGGGSGASSTTQNQVDYSTNNAHVVYKQDFDFVKSRVYIGNDVINSYQYTETWNRTANGFMPTSLKSLTKYNETQVAPFAQYEFSPLNGLFKDGFLASLDNLRFNFGMRYEDYQQKYVSTTAAANGSLLNLPGSATKTVGQNYSKIIKKGGLSYEYQKDHMFWYNAGDGWVVPNTGSMVATAYPKERA